MQSIKFETNDDGSFDYLLQIIFEDIYLIDSKLAYLEKLAASQQVSPPLIAKVFLSVVNVIA